MDIQVEIGDIITFKSGKQILVTEEKNYDFNTIKKIKRVSYNGWHTIWEQKEELLTEEEKEFLRQVLKFGNYGRETIKFIIKDGYYIELHYKDWAYNTIYIDEKLYFKNLEATKEYTLKELGLEEK